MAKANERYWRFVGVRTFHDINEIDRCKNTEFIPQLKRKGLSSREG